VLCAARMRTHIPLTPPSCPRRRASSNPQPLSLRRDASEYWIVRFPRTMTSESCLKFESKNHPRRPGLDPGPITTSACGLQSWVRLLALQLTSRVMGPVFRRDDTRCHSASVCAETMDCFAEPVIGRAFARPLARHDDAMASVVTIVDARLSTRARCPAAFPALRRASDTPRCLCRRAGRCGSSDIAPGRGCPVRPATGRSIARS
jgi:hypothetical protein